MKIRWLLPWMLSAGCAVAPPPEPAPGAPPLPQAWYSGRANVHSVIAEQSEVLIYVYRDGPLARLGHNHVIRVADLAGLVHLTEDLSAARADLAFSAANLQVDPRAEREASGPEFATTLSEADVAATRRNMLGPDVLDAASHPFVRIRVRLLEREGDTLRVAARITLKGVAHTYEERASLRATAGGIELSGTLSVAQSDFRLLPFRILGGAVSVKDELRIRYRLVAMRPSDS